MTREVSLPPPIRATATVFALVSVALTATAATAQDRAALAGRVTDRDTGAPAVGATVSVEGLDLGAFTDSTGVFRLIRVPPGPQVVVVQLIGYATARVSVTVPNTGVLGVEVALATSALRVEGVTVTADPVSRARGELGTASVIVQDAIDAQTATSLTGLLELTPGIELRAPGLDGVEQIGLRAAPTSSVVSLGARGPSAAELASFGTLVVLDGVPVSNNANLQTTGPRGELRVPTSADGGIDLRRIPASTLERVEVIRGVPSARYGDLTQGVIVVDTRAGAFEPRFDVLLDPFTLGGSLVGGWGVAVDDALSANLDVTSTHPNPGFSDDQSSRFSSQLSHRARLGLAHVPPAGMGQPLPRFVLDTRVDLYQVLQDSPEDSVVSPGASSWNRDRGMRLSERARMNLSPDFRLEFAGSLDYTQQRSFVEAPRFRGALPFTDRLTEGRQIGRYIGGSYQSQVSVDGDVGQLYARLEADRQGDWWGGQHRLRLGGVLRREWNAGDGYQFDVEFPPQVTFNGVQGFDRPRAFREIDPVAASAVYVDDRFVGSQGGTWSYDVQAGLRLDLLNDGGTWWSGVRDALVQPRLNVQVSAGPSLRVRGSVGRTAKQPTLAALSPSPQYFDVVNVNWYTPDPAERLAVLTTFIRDPGNPDLGYSDTWKTELGLEVSSHEDDFAASLTAFHDETTGAVGIRSTPVPILRDRFALSDSTIGNGTPPEIVEPPIAVDSVPVLLDVPANNLSLTTRGLELSVLFPEVRALRTRLQIQGAVYDTELIQDGLDFGTRFGGFQLDERVPRAPFWESVTQTGVQALVNYRLVFHEPDLGLVVTGTVQHFAYEKVQNVAGTDTLAWSGYVTRGASLVEVPEEDRGLPEYADLRQARTNVVPSAEEVAPGWLLSLQASLELPWDGRLSVWAFNALDRPGSPGGNDRSRRVLPSPRFGLEGIFRLGWITGSGPGPR